MPLPDYVINGEDIGRNKTPIGKIPDYVLNQPDISTTQPKEESFISKASDVAMSGVSGFNKGIASGVGMPIDLINQGLGLVGLDSKEPVGGSNWINKKIMPKGKKPEGYGENIAEAIGEQVGMASVPFNTALGYVKATGNITAPIIKTILGDLEKMPLEKLIKIESSIAAGAGTASGITREQTDNPYADLAAQLVGGLGVGVSTSILETAKNTIQNNLTKKGVINKTKEVFKESVPNVERFDANLEKTKNIEKAMDVDNIFTTAQATGVPSFNTSENAIMRKSDPVSVKFAEDILSKRANANKKISEFGDNIIPKGDIIDTRESLLANEKNVKSKVSEVTDKYFNINKQEKGETILKELKDAKNKKYEEMKGLFDELGEANPVINADDLNNTLDTLSKPRFEGGSIASVPKGIINRIKSTIKTTESLKGITHEISYNSARGFRSEIKTLIRNEQMSSNPNGDKISRLVELGQSMDNALDKLIAGNTKEGSLYKTAKERYKEEYLPYKQGTAAQILQKGARGEDTRIALEDIAKKYLAGGKGDITSAQNFIKTIGDRVTAKAALKDATIQDVIEMATDPNTGLISPSKLTLWLKNNNDALQFFPEIKKEVTNIKSLQGQVDEAVKTSLFAQGDIDRIIPNILTAKNPTQEISKILRIVKDDKKSIDGLKKSIWEYALNKTEARAKDIDGFNTYNPNVLRDFREKYNKVFSQLYTPEELGKMDTFTDAYEIFRKTSSSPYGSGSPTAEFLNAQHGNLAKAIGFFSSRISGLPYYVAVSIGQTIKSIAGKYSQHEKQTLINEALLNPDISDTFIKMSKNAPVSYIAKKFNTALRNLSVAGSKDPFGIKGEQE